MEIIVKRQRPEISASQSKVAQPSAYNKQRHGAWGIVKALNSDDNTVDVFLASGVHLKRVPVSSTEWVISGEDAEKDYNTGERNLPPENARVFVMMPTGTYDDCFVLCSGFSTIDQTKPFMEDDKGKIKERITPSGWHITDDNVTGSHKSVSPDEKTSLEIDYGTEEEPKKDESELCINLFDNELTLDHKQGDSCVIKVFDTEIVIKKGDVLIKPKKTTIEVDGDAEIKTSGKTTIEAAGDATVKGENVTVEATTSATVKAAQVAITGGKLTVNGTSSPNSGPFCALPSCLFTGAPHGSNMVIGT
jgi:hypothetical protein